MENLGIIFRRELMGYFATPLAYIFIVIFLITNGIFTFDIGGFYLRGQADLLPFFSFHPWLYLFMVPAIAMTLWADERKTGTIELLLTLPIKLSEAVLGKFLAAWVLTGIALALTFPIWITVNYLGDPDNGVILAAYIGSWFMAGLPQFIVDAFAALGFLTHFDSISKGVLDIRDFLYFTVFIAAWLLASAIVIEIKKAN